MYIADLHLHSRYSMATAKTCDPEHLELWGRKKGIHVLGTGDFTHPAWRQELEEKLEKKENGLYCLKEEYSLAREYRDAAYFGMKPQFVITGEISCVYQKHGKTRRVHNLIVLPDLNAADRISGRLEQVGNIKSDGRPILKIDSRDLLELVLDCCPDAVFIPAHVWTPHYSMFGAFTAFESVESCFEDMAVHIHALETGLSADPSMFWQISALDQYQLISNSDAHSPEKLGREASVFTGEPSYGGLYVSLTTGKGLSGTLEFFPQEGKYYAAGHRKCQVCLSIEEAKMSGGICPVCNKKLTAGVSGQIARMADREIGIRHEEAKAFYSIMPLKEIIAEYLGKRDTSVMVKRMYEQMIAELGAELSILTEMPVKEIALYSGERLAEGIARLRDGQVECSPGYDGEYGTVKLFFTNSH